MASLILAAEYNVYFTPIALAMPFILTYLITSLLASETFRARTKDRKPPLAPYWTPVLGHAFMFFWDTGVVAKLTKYDLMLEMHETFERDEHADYSSGVRCSTPEQYVYSSSPPR